MSETLRSEAERRGVSVWQVRKGRGEQDSRDCVLLRLDPELRDALKRAAEDHGVSMNWMASKAIAEFLDHLLPANEVRLTR